MFLENEKRQNCLLAVCKFCDENINLKKNNNRILRKSVREV